VPMGLGIATALPPHMSSMSGGQAPSAPTPNRNDRDKDRPIDMRVCHVTVYLECGGVYSANTLSGRGGRSEKV
jgi:hypothetical protein